MIAYNMLGNYGRLGNQMFQLACLISVSDHMGKEAVAPISGQYNVGSRVGDCFKDLDVSVKDAYLNEQAAEIYSEEVFRYDDKIFDLDPEKNWSLRGYFQTEKYFSRCRDKIRDLFTFKDEVVEGANRLGLETEGRVAVHIRRTDYHQLQDFHPFPPEEYYVNALSEMGDRDFLVFSDDIPWCKEQKMFDSDRVSFSSGDQYQDLYLMSNCSSHIIANSSFSWWGAWLAQGDRVIAPKTWFGHKGPQDWQDIYCEGWEKA